MPAFRAICAPKGKYRIFRHCVCFSERKRKRFCGCRGREYPSVKIRRNRHYRIVGIPAGHLLVLISWADRGILLRWEEVQPFPVPLMRAAGGVHPLASFCSVCIRSEIVCASFPLSGGTHFLLFCMLFSSRAFGAAREDNCERERGEYDCRKKKH